MRSSVQVPHFMLQTVLQCKGVHVVRMYTSATLIPQAVLRSLRLSRGLVLCRSCGGPNPPLFPRFRGTKQGGRVAKARKWTMSP